MYESHSFSGLDTIVKVDNTILKKVQAVSMKAGKVSFVNTGNPVYELGNSKPICFSRGTSKLNLKNVSMDIVLIAGTIDSTGIDRLLDQRTTIEVELVNGQGSRVTYKLSGFERSSTFKAGIAIDDLVHTWTIELHGLSGTVETN